MKTNLRGNSGVYIILILLGVISISYLLTGGLLPKIKQSDTFTHFVSEVYESDEGEKQDNMQLYSLGFNPESVTIYPLLSLTPTEASQQPEQNVEIQQSSEELDGQVNPSPTILAQNRTIAPSQLTSTPSVTSPAENGITPNPIDTQTPTPTPVSASLPTLTTFQKRLLAIARSQKGDHYNMGACESWYTSGTRPGDPPKQSDGCLKWDCSNFVAWAYYWVTNGQFRMKSQTCADFGKCYDYSNNYKSENPGLYTKFYKSDLGRIQFGDLVYFGSISNGKYYPTHVGLYIGRYGNCGGDDCIIDASASGGGVSERRLAKVPKGIIGFLRPKL